MKQQRKKITLDVVKKVYQFSKRVHEGSLNEKRARYKLIKDVGMNPNSATYYIQAFLNMTKGKRYGKTINKTATRYFLENILRTSGKQGLKVALSSIKKHIEGYEKPNRNGKLRRLPSIKNIYQEFLKRYHNVSQ